MTSNDTGSLREQKKVQTRLAIADAAFRLFLERGFANVTVAQVAEAAGVSEKTVFNHFSSKEELVFDLDPIIETQLLTAVRERRRGTSVLDAVRHFARQRTLAPHGEPDPRERIAELKRQVRTEIAEAIEEQLRGDGRAGGLKNRMRAMRVRKLVEDEIAHAMRRHNGRDETKAWLGSVGEGVAAMRRLIESSPELMAYWRRMFTRYEENLRKVLLDELEPNDDGGRVEATMLAAAIIALLRAEMELGGEELGGVRRARRIEEGLRRLEHGFTRFGMRRKR